MGTHHYVTSDWDVLKGWPKTEKNVTSAEVAASLGLTVFQITSRLKGMERRNLVARNERGLWGLTPAGIAERQNPSPSVSGKAKTMRATDAAGIRSGPPDDSAVPRIKITKADWAPSDQTLKECQQRLPEVLRHLAGYMAEKSRYKREIMALQVEKEHCEGVIKAKRRGKWISRVNYTAHMATTVYIAPDMREYVMASPWEVADLIIENPVKDISDTRLRLFSTSSVAKRGRKHERIEQADAAREAAKKQEVRNKRIVRAENASGSARLHAAEEVYGTTDDLEATAEVLEFTAPRALPRRGDRGRLTPPRREKEDGRKPKLYGGPNSDSRRVQAGKGKVVAKVQPARDSRDGKRDSRPSRDGRSGDGRNQQVGQRKAGVRSPAQSRA